MFRQTSTLKRWRYCHISRSWTLNGAAEGRITVSLEKIRSGGGGSGTRTGAESGAAALPLYRLIDRIRRQRLRLPAALRPGSDSGAAAELRSAREQRLRRLESDAPNLRRDEPAIRLRQPLHRRGAKLDPPPLPIQRHRHAQAEPSDAAGLPDDLLAVDQRQQLGREIRVAEQRHHPADDEDRRQLWPRQVERRRIGDPTV